jgi:hypothetical protein
MKEGSREACSKHGKDEKHTQGFGQKDMRRRNHSEDLDIDERIILR